MPTTVQDLGMDISVKATGAKQVDKLALALEHLQSVSLRGLTSKINSLENMMRPFKDMTAAKGINKFANSLNKLQSVNVGNAATSLQNMASALKPLTNEMIRGQSAAASYAAVISKLSAKAITSGNAFKKASKGVNVFSGSFQRLVVAFYLVKQIKDVMGTWVTEANNYIENLNLFAVAMGDYYDQAKAYAESVGDTLGIDPSQWMRQQGIIMDMAKSFGVAAEQAYTMSKALTQIAYDFSSLYNLDIAESLKKVQSGLAGEIEPLRRIGKDLSVAKMQLVATELGLTQNVSKMTQADKAMLRTIVLLRQSGSAMGDLARTINSPANQLRIFNAQVIQLKRALGYILLPTLQMMLPYLIAMAKVLRLISTIIAGLFGFKLPEFNYDSLQGNLALGASSTSDIADNMKSAAKSAAKINSYKAGFDELNVIDTSSGASGGTGGTGGIGGIGGQSDILAEEMKRLTDAYDKTFLAGIDDKVTKIVGNLLEWLGIGELIVGQDGEMSIKMKEITGWTDLLFTKLGLILTVLTTISTLGIIGSIAKLLMPGSAINTGLFLVIGLFSKLAGVVYTVIRAAGILAAAIGFWPLVIIGAVALAVYLIIKHWDDIVKFFTETIPNWWKDTVIPFFSNMWESIVEFFKAIPENIGAIWTSVMTKFSEWGTAVWDFITIEIPKWIAGVVAWFAGLPEKIGFAIGFLIGKLIAWGENIVTWITTNVPIFITNIVDFFIALPGKIYDGIILIIGKFILWKESVETWIKDNVSKIIDDIVDWFKSLPQKALDALNGLKQKIITWKNNAVDWVKEYVPKIINSIINWFKELPESLVNIGTNMIRGLWNGITNAGSWLWNKLKGFFGGIWDVVESFFGGVGEGVQVGYKSVPTYATGGLPEDGMFMANSTELVGQFTGGRTAVINNAQIIEGVSSGVAEAVTQAMTAVLGDKNETINVNVDGENLFKINRKTGSRKGQQLVQPEYAR